MGWPRRFSAAAASTRRITSTEDPAAKGTINVRGRVGKVSARPERVGLNSIAPAPARRVPAEDRKLRLGNARARLRLRSPTPLLALERATSDAPHRRGG